MSARNWIKVWMIIWITLFSMIVFLNYYVDSYSILWKKYSKIHGEPNQNFIKIDFLLHEKHNFDSFIFGSSRVGFITPNGIDGGKYYNMTYSEGLPLEHLENIKLLLEHGIPIKNILIGIDDFSYEVDPKEHLVQPMRLLHYKSKFTNMNKFSFYMYYFFKLPSKFDMLKLINKLFFDKKSLNIELDLRHTGLPVIPKEIDENIEKNYESHMKNKRFFNPTYYRGNRIKETIEDIKEIVYLSKKYKFNLVLFFNPIHKTTYLDTDFENMQLFKYELSKFSKFYDFSGLNTITTNNYYFYETSHYRYITGDLIKSRIFNNTSKNVPKDFGTLVTNDNILEHLKNLEKQIALFETNSSN